MEARNLVLELTYLKNNLGLLLDWDAIFCSQSFAAFLVNRLNWLQHFLYSENISLGKRVVSFLLSKGLLGKLRPGQFKSGLV